jgi:hypothetical protein
MRRKSAARAKEKYMKYMLTIFGDESGMEDATPEQMQESSDAWQKVTDEIKEAGAFEAGEGLQPSATATTVRVSAPGDEPTVTDGPFAETKEQLGGFYLIDVENLDQALEWAKKLPIQGGGVEVRPAMVFDEPAAENGAAPEAETAEATS